MSNKPYGVRNRTLTIRNHLNEMVTAAKHMDFKRMESYRSLIEDHLYEIDKDMETMDLLARRITA